MAAFAIASRSARIAETGTAAGVPAVAARAALVEAGATPGPTGTLPPPGATGFAGGGVGGEPSGIGGGIPAPEDDAEITLLWPLAMGKPGWPLGDGFTCNGTESDERSAVTVGGSICIGGIAVDADASCCAPIPPAAAWLGRPCRCPSTLGGDGDPGEFDTFEIEFDAELADPSGDAVPAIPALPPLLEPIDDELIGLGAAGATC